MKRVTFRVPEDHDITVGGEIERYIMHGHDSFGTRAEVIVERGSDGWGITEPWRYVALGPFDSLAEAQDAAGNYLRTEVRRKYLAAKTAALV